MGSRELVWHTWHEHLESSGDDCVFSPLVACSQHAAREWRECLGRYRVGVGWGRPRCTSTLLSLPLLLYLSVYLFLTIFSCPSEQQFLSLKMARAQGVACAGSTGRASWGGRGPSMGPRPHAPCFLPTTGSPSLGLTRLYPHRLRPFYLRFTSQLPLLCKTRGTR